MNEFEKPKGVNPEDKEAINKEGWEDNAAVIIGKKEGGEIDRLRENLEKGDHYADVATYVRLNKRIVLPLEAIFSEKKKEKIKDMKGKGWIGSKVLVFIDKEGNTAEVDLKFDKIDSVKSGYLQGKEWQHNAQLIVEELKPYGFSIECGFPGEYYDLVGFERDHYKQELIMKNAEREKTEFDF